MTTGPPQEETAAVKAAREFVGAVAWGEHSRVWDLLGSEGRRVVLRIASERGMADILAARIRGGTAADSERDRFLSDLVNGLRADLAGTDLDALRYWADEEAADPERTWVVLMAPLPAALGGEVPVGTVELSQGEDGWLVERLIPRPAAPGR